MKILARFLLALSIVLVGSIGAGMFLFHPATVSACGGWFEPSCASQEQGNAVQDNLNKLTQQVPIPNLSNSIERSNISKRLTAFSDPNKISYIYLVSYGRVMAFYTIKGKVTSGSKRLTAQSVSVDSCGNIAGIGQSLCTGSFNVEQPELDGTYGSSNPYVYFWTTSGAYIQWSGDYMLADQPLQLSTAPELTMTVK